MHQIALRTPPFRIPNVMNLTQPLAVWDLVDATSPRELAYLRSKNNQHLAPCPRKAEAYDTGSCVTRTVSPLAGSVHISGYERQVSVNL
jgi:hypothetical protein